MLHRTAAFALAIAILLTALPATAAGKLMGGDVPPDFVGVDPEGNEIRISDSRGKVVALVFWASWCGRCRAELPLLEKLQVGMGREHLHVIGVNFKESTRDYRRLRRALKYTMTMTHDPDGVIGEAYNVNGIPHLVLIDRAGRIAYINVGFDSERTPPELVQQFNELLNEKPPG